MNHLKKPLPVVIPLISWAWVFGGELKLSPIYTDNMVVQRDHPVVLLGTAEPGEKIAADFAGGKSQAVADAKGAFRIQLPARKADKQGRVLTLQSGGKMIELKEVLVGDVWLCAGQSNMEFDMQRLNIADEARTENRPLIRRIKFKETFQPFPVDPMQVVVTGAWQAGTPQTIATWTATGYYFARSIQDRNPDVPLGLYECAYSGSPIECWIPMETWADFPTLKEGAEVANRRKDPGLSNSGDREAWRMPSGMYNAMMQCLTATPVAGAIWYQGEGNAGQADYAIKMQAMVSGWRKAWGIDFPFYYVQLAGYMAPHFVPHTSSLTPRPSHLVPHTSSVTLRPPHFVPHTSSLTLRRVRLVELLGRSLLSRRSSGTTKCKRLSVCNQTYPKPP